MALRIWQSATYRIVIIVCTIAYVCLASGASADYSSLMKLILDNEDTRMSADDLAFFLATHDFDAMPEGDHVIVKLNSTVYKVTPNGEKTGLAEVMVMS